MQRIFADGTKARYDFFRSNYIGKTGATETQQFVSKDPDVTATCACRQCNSGWMDRARLRIEPIIEPMITGKPTRVTRLADIAALATWATQVGLCAAYQTTDLASAMAPAFYQNRMPPKGHRIRLAAAVMPETTLQVALNVVQLFSAPAHDPTRVEGYTVTIRINHFILQVFCPPAGHETEVESKPEWHGRTIPIWPLTHETIAWRWPPHHPLDVIDFHFLTQAYFEQDASH